MKEIKMERSITNRNQDGLERYLQDISKYPLLNAEEEIVLSRKIRAGDREALHRLVNCNLRFVVTVAKKYETQDISLADLVADGNMGLFKAAERFDETRGFKFISYAVWWIRHSILLGINVYKHLVRMPGNQITGTLELWKIAIKLEQELQRVPTKAELARCMNISEDMAHDYLYNYGKMYAIDASFEDQDGGGPVSGAFIDLTCALPDQEMEQEGFKNDMERMMELLTPRERHILCLAYGVGAQTPMQNDDICNALGLSAETIRRTKKNALERLRSIKGVQMMRGYLQ